MATVTSREMMHAPVLDDAPDAALRRPSGSGLRFSLIHLSGRRRGETQFFQRAPVTFGSAPGVDVSFPANGECPVAPLQAEMFQANCEMRLRNCDPAARTLVNREAVEEIILRDRDMIQLGPNGPTLRFRIRPEEYTLCKQLKEILQDARDVASAGRADERVTLRSFVGQLAFEIVRNATLATQVVVVGLLVMLIAAIGGLAYYNYLTQQAHERHIASLLRELELSRISLAELEQNSADERRRLTETLAIHETEEQRLMVMVEEQRKKGASSEALEALTLRLRTLEAERNNAELLITRFGPSTCLLYIAYGFVEKGDKEEAPHTLLEYTGTGFLIDAEGRIVTNRHLAEPWSMDPKGTAEMLQAGLEPRLVIMRAYFPGRAQAYDVTVLKLSEQGDVALAQLTPEPRGMTPVPLEKPSPQAVPGEAVVVVGYPSGLEGILARLDEHAATELLKGAERNLQKLMQDLADRGLVRPLTTQGHVSDAVPNRIIHDAQTTSGGSGSPIFNSQGELIAVHSSIMTRFGAVGSGVPAARVDELLHSDS